MGDQFIRDLEPTKPNPPPGSTLSRSGTLSWNQRPLSHGSGGTRSRPLSLAMPDSQKSRSPSPEARDLSMTERAQALEGKDPAFFRQTADRGKNSAAFRKNQDTVSDVSRGQVPLPTLAAYKSTSPERSPGSELESPMSSLRIGTSSPNPTLSERFSTLGSRSSARSPLPVLASQIFDPPSSSGTSPSLVGSSAAFKKPLVSPTQGTSSPDRPASPTKGVGGFVQSAMMKRADSVNKRLSKTSAGGLSRGNSINRAAQHSKAGSLSRETTPLQPEGLGLDYGKAGRDAASLVSGSGAKEHEVTKEKSSKQLGSRDMKDDETMQPGVGKMYEQDETELTRRLDAKMIEDDNTESGISKQLLAPIRTDIKRPSSPTKLWSPSKTSWLESTLNKPHEKKSKPPPRTPQQPAWKVALEKSKQNKDSVDASKTPNHKEVAVGGFLRSTPRGVNIKSSSSNDVVADKGNISSESDSPATPTTPQGWGYQGVDMTRLQESKSSPSISNPSATGAGQDSNSPLLSKSKPEAPPKKDFRSNLAPRQMSDDKGKSGEPEFKNVFGKLRKTETKNYVAPDELKHNILRGKAGLNITGGPRDYVKRDDFKDSILKKKEEMKTGTSSVGKINPLQAEEKAIPEALAKRQRMTARSSVDEAPAAPPIASKQQSTEKVVGAVIPQPLVPEKKASAPARLQGASTAAESGLAGRFNPALAGLLARGPPSISKGASGGGFATVVESTGGRGHSGESSAAPQLTHATKSRARGPKRRAPTSKTEDSLPVSASPEPLSSGGSSPSKLEPLPTISSVSISPPTIKPKLTPKPATAATTSSPHPPTSQATRSPTLAPKSPPIAKPKPVFDQKLDSKNEVQLRSTGLGLGIKGTSSKSPPTPGKKADSLSRIASGSSLTSPPPVRTMSRDISSPIPNTTAAGNLFKDFFDEAPATKKRADVDTQAIWQGKPAPMDMGMTLEKRVWEITGDGKKTAVPQSSQHILYEDKMYMCSHTFVPENGKKSTDVYLWHGDGVSASAVDDAQLFGRSAARDAGGKLILLSQGKESAKFIDALGGILITRRGSSSSASTTYMLVGRRHIGQMAFDEVDYSAGNLCSGFPFIISATGGVLFLWKGKGAGAEEVGCGRLVGMDLGLTGEIEEIEEGKEPSSFWDHLQVDDKFTLPESFWHRRSSSSKYNTRLFTIDTRPRSTLAQLWGRRTSQPGNDSQDTAQITEISPYTQADLTKENIHVLDTFFEIYV